MQNSIEKITLMDDILSAAKRIKGIANITPVLTSTSMNLISGSNLFFKCENFQKVGAFKFRGAYNAVSSLSEIELKRGVATHSSGNHAAALALSAQIKGVKSYIIMPENSPKIKKTAVQGYGADITFCESTQQAREETLAKIVEQTGAVFIHPYDNYKIIEGQATTALELINKINDLDFIIAPVGGGGLLSGTALATKYFSPNTKVVAAEPQNADDAFRSIRDNKIYPSINPKTIADGLRTSLSEKTFAIIKDDVSEIITVSEEAISNAMRLVWERMKIIIEPSSAVPVAAILENKAKFSGKKVGIIISGGNVELSDLPW